MLKALGSEALPKLKQYIARHHDENIMLMHDIVQGGTMDQLTLTGWTNGSKIVAISGRYASGRWFPHYVDDAALPLLLAEDQEHSPRWVMGVARVVDPLVAAIVPDSVTPSYDERDHVCDVDANRLADVQPGTSRMAIRDDIPALADLRCQFDAEYFGTDPRRISRTWAERVAANYVQLGAAIAILSGRPVAMVATEAIMPQLAQIAGVFTMPHYRGRGLAHQGVALLCRHHLRSHPRVTLNVRRDNLVAIRVYRSLGFTPCGAYRMTRLR